MKNDLKLSPQSSFGPYQILRLLGQGGMGEVYEAVQMESGLPVALKVSRQTNDPEASHRFNNEIRALKLANHPHIVKLIDSGEHMGVPYLAMELVKGDSLDQYIEQKVFRPVEAMKIIKQVAEGVLALHDQKIVHRDLKAKNILCLNDQKIKIIDFGVVKFTDDPPLEITKTGAIVGSVKYVSPEVATGQPAVFQSDIWSLGILAYELMVGTAPFDGQSYQEILEQIRLSPLTFPPVADRTIPENIKKIVHKMCEKNVHLRYANMKELLADINQVMSANQEETNPLETTQFLRSQIANENKVRKLIKKAGFKDGDIKVLMSLALRIQQEKSPQGDFSSAWVIEKGALDEAIKSFLDSTDSSQLPPKKNAYLWWAGVGFAALWALLFSTSLDLSMNVHPDDDEGVALEAPVQAGKVWVEPQAPVHFRWSKALTTPTELQIAIDSSFQEIIEKVEVTNRKELTVTLPEEGPYYWRLFDHQSSTAIGSSEPFFLIHKTAPVVKTISLKSGSKVEFSWLSKVGVKTYRLQIAKDKQFTNLLFDQRVHDTHFETSLPAGRYFWRVSTFEGTPIDALWSVGEVTVKTERQPASSKQNKKKRRKNRRS